MIPFSKFYNEQVLEEKGFGTTLATLGLASTLLFPHNADGATKKAKPAIVEQIPTTLPFIAKYIATHEGYRTRVYLDSKGNPTIGIGHLMTSNDKQLFSTLFGDKVNLSNILSKKSSLTEGQVLALFNHDLNNKMGLVNRLFPSYDTYSEKTKAAIVDGVFRGDLSGSPATVKLINDGKWAKAAAEYLNNTEYKDAVKSGSGVAKRMKENSVILADAGAAAKK